MHSSSNIMVAICYHYDFWKFFLIALLYTYFWVIIILKRMSYSKSYFIILCNIFIIFLALTIGWLFYIKRLAKCIFYGSTCMYYFMRIYINCILSYRACLIFHSQKLFGYAICFGKFPKNISTFCCHGRFVQFKICTFINVFVFLLLFYWAK